MLRATAARALLASAVLVGSAYVTLTRPAQLGLDLRGGTQIVLEARDTPTIRADAQATDQALEVLRRRVDALGVAEPTLARSGENRIIVELPGVQDPREAAAVIGRTAQLTFHPVLGAAASSSAEPPASGAPLDTSRELTLPDESGQPLRLGPAALAGDAVRGADAVLGSQLGGWQVSIDFKGAGARSWERLTADAACAAPGDPQRRVAIVLDGAVISAPQVTPEIRCGVGITGGSTVITGSFSQQEADDLALLIKAGALPVPVEVIQQQTVGATLGEQAIRASVQAALIGALLTMVFLIVVYRLVGVLAAVTLAAYALISYAALVALGATLTLPGIAGFVLAIGMAVDANVLVFERSREVYAARGGGRLIRAVREGYRGALSAITDSNVTTLLAAGLLFFLATGPVRGFGVTLSIGVLASLFSALVLTRALTELTIGAVQRRPAWSGLADLGRVRRWLTARDPQLMRHSRRWLLISALAVAVGLAGIGLRGLNLGLEFTGGRLVEYATAQPVDAEQARRVVAEAGVETAVVQTSGDRGISVRAAGFDDAESDRVRAGLERVGGPTDQVRDEFVGPSLGNELRRKALIALGVALAVQLIYLAIRFRPAFGAAAVVAMAHDVVVLVGIFAWLGRPIDGVFLAALLTVIGYSVNDSVVIFDRVRELLRGRRRGRSVADIANTACLQTVPRTVNTGLGAIFILAALALLGGDTLTDFALALLIGVLVGTWSSVFTATPLAVEFLRRRPSRPEPARRPAARRPVAGRPTARRSPRDSGARL